LEDKNEKQKNFISSLVEQNQLLQERVVALELMMKEKTDRDNSDAALVNRVDVLEQKLDAFGESLEDIKSALAAWALKD
jgi:hypothetical protein